jgi:hypothetical protein
MALITLNTLIRVRVSAAEKQRGCVTTHPPKLIIQLCGLQRLVLNQLFVRLTDSVPGAACDDWGMVPFTRFYIACVELRDTGCCFLAFKLNDRLSKPHLKALSFVAGQSTVAHFILPPRELRPRLVTPITFAVLSAQSGRQTML